MSGSHSAPIDPFEVSIKVRTGGALTSGLKGLSFGKYHLVPLPSNADSDFKGELLLNFKEDQIPSHPLGEGKIISAWLSVILKQKIIVDASRLKNINISKTKTENISFETECAFPENIEELYKKFKSLPLANENNLLERYARACKVYQEAILLSNVNPTLSFFLLVTAIECVSTKDYDFHGYLMQNLAKKDGITKGEIESIHENFVKEYGIKTNFIKFILENFEDWQGTFSEEEFKKLLASVYKIRSNFTHSGYSIEEYLRIVDTILKGKTVSVRIDNKESEVPGLNYFSEIVRKVLIKFLERQPDLDCDNLPKLALQDGTVTLWVTKDIQEGVVITNGNIKHRK